MFSVKSCKHWFDTLLETDVFVSLCVCSVFKGVVFYVQCLRELFCYIQ